jgi:hypothetical protein
MGKTERRDTHAAARVVALAVLAGVLSRARRSVPKLNRGELTLLLRAVRVDTAAIVGSAKSDREVRKPALGMAILHNPRTTHAQ